MSVLSQSAGLLFRLDADSSGFKRELAAVDASIGSLGSKFTSFGGVASIATAGVAALGAGALIAAKNLFDLTSTASEFGEIVFDASKKTGLGAAAISSLKAAAEQSGSSLEAVTKGIAKFAKQYEGTGADLRTELGKTFKQIADAKPGFEQLTLAQEKFGKSGADLIPMILSFGGDLEGLIAKMEELGITIDDEAAAAADAFGDQMDVLGAQIAGVGRTIGTAFMPQFTRMAATVSGWLVQNKDNVSTFATVTANAFSTFLRGLESVASWVERNKDVLNVIFNLTTAGAYGLAMYGLKNEFNRLRQPGPETVQEASGSGRSGGFDPDKIPGLGKVGRSSNSDAEKAKREAEALARRDLAAQISLESKNLDTVRNQLAETMDGIRDVFEKDGDTDAFFASSREAMERFTGALQTSLSWLEALENRSRSTMTENEKALLSANQLERRQQAVNLGKAEYGKNRATLAKQEKIWDDEANARAEYNIKLQRQQLEQLEEKRKLNQAISDQMIANLKLIDPVFQNQPNGDGKAGETPYNPFQSWIDGWTQFVKQIDADAPTLGQTFQSLGGIFVNAFAGMAQSLGGVVSQWVLMGSTGPAVMRKILASALASIAAEAAVRAIWELALGFATLFTNPSESAGHFVAAALFGSVAVGSALAGRAIAGNAFNQQTQTATGQGASSANSGQGSAGKAGVYSSQEDMIVERGRNTIAGRLGTVLVKIQTTKDHVLDVVTEGLRNNSPIRVEVQNAVA